MFKSLNEFDTWLQGLKGEEVGKRTLSLGQADISLEPAEGERGFLEETVSALGAGAVSTLGAIGGTAEMLGIPGGKTAREYWEEIGQRESLGRPEYLQEGTIWEHPERLADWRWWARSVGENLPNMAAMMLPGLGAMKAAKLFGWGAKAIKTVALAAGWSGAFTVEAGYTYNQAKKEMAGQGYSDQEIEQIATMEGLTVGVVNGILEILPFKALFLDKMGGPRVIRRIVRWAWVEGTTEVAQEAVNVYVEKLGHKPDQTLSENIGRLIEAGIIGATLGGGVAVTVGRYGVEPEKKEEIAIGESGSPDNADLIKDIGEEPALKERAAEQEEISEKEEIRKNASDLLDQVMIEEEATAEEVPETEEEVLPEEITGEIVPERVEEPEEIFEEPLEVAPPVEEEIEEVEEKPTASFLAWQETPEGDHVAMYNIESGPKEGTQVMAEGLKREGIEIPETPEKPPKVVPVKEKVEEPKPIPEAKAKEPYKKTLKEYVEDYGADWENVKTRLDTGEKVEYGRLTGLEGDRTRNAVKYHWQEVDKAIREGKITSHPDYPELGKLEEEKPAKKKPAKAVTTITGKKAEEEIEPVSEIPKEGVKIKVKTGGTGIVKNVRMLTSDQSEMQKGSRFLIEVTKSKDVFVSKENVREDQISKIWNKEKRRWILFESKPLEVAEVKEEVPAEKKPSPAVTTITGKKAEEPKPKAIEKIKEEAEPEVTVFKIGDYVTVRGGFDAPTTAEFTGKVTHINTDSHGNQDLSIDGGRHFSAMNFKLTKPPKEPIIKEKEVEERAEEKPRILREPGEEPLEGAPPEHVPGAREERAPGERPPARRGEDFGGYGESDIRSRPEGTRGLGDGEGKIRPSPERGRPAELGRQHSSGRNYRITDADALEEGGPVAKYDRNIAAINLLKKIEGENRPATPEEQVTLVKYVGWGGLSEVFKSPAWRETPWDKRAKKLEALLTEEEYESARKSTPNAHFTSPLVMNHIYDALNWMGFDGGRIIEPSMGIGHFFGRMPGDWRTKLVGIELDSISGRIAKLLYPDADVRIQGYEETKLPNNFFDLAISNVPFGDYKVFDPDYAKLKFFIHDYFFAKSLDKVRPNGLIAFITSAGMMNKKDKRIRRYIAERAELIGAIRLPSNAFKKIANTEVTTDIIFLRKLKEGEKPKGVVWQDALAWETKEGDSFPINEYFHNNPNMQLGKIVRDKLHYQRAGLESDGRDLGEALKGAIETMQQGFYEKIRHKATTEGPKIADMVPAPEHIKNFAYFAKGDSIYQKQVIEGVAQTLVVKLSKTDMIRMKTLINLRDKTRGTLHNQLENKEELLESDLKELNKLYDSFVKKYGPIHENTNVRLFKGDPDRPLLLSLEHWDADKKTATKADIFRQRTMAKYIPVEKVETAEDALIATVFDRGRIDFAHMSKISGKSEGTLKEELKGLIFLDPEKNGWQTAEEYLSGNVRTKLEAAEAAAEIDPKYKENVAALKKVQPEDKMPSQITARLGANWIPEKDIEGFLFHLLEARGYKPRYISATSQWVLEKEEGRVGINDVLNEQKWGIPDVDAISLVSDALNLKIPTVYVTVKVEGQERRVIDRSKTLLAQAKQQEIKEEFERWIWEDTERRDNLAKIYNEKFNNIRLRKYAGDHLPDRLPGMAMGVSLRAHQKDNTWRIVQGKNTLLAQVVGSGKTLSMTAAAMELRRLGLAKKPLFVVPKHLLKSWEAEFLKFYPAAKILVPEEKSLTPERRQEFMARITTGDWDAIVISHPNMMKLPISKKVQNDFIRSQLAELEDAIHAEESEEVGYGRPKKSRTVKELEKAKKRLDEKLQVLLAGGEKDTGVTFEELGVDYMFIDESHNFKNLWFATRMTRVAGVQSSDVAKTTDLFLKSRYLTSLNNGRGVVFATGTPISNSMAEMYTIQRYLDMDALKELNIHNFDAWAGTFGEIAAELEVTPTGAGFRVHTRFRNFVNMDQLSTLFRDFADVLHSEDLPHLPVPKLEDGKPKIIKADISPEQKEYVNGLEARMKEIRSGGVDPRDDNALVVTLDGTKAALDMRLIDPTLPDNPESKANLMVNKVFNIYRSTTDAKSTQLLFCDFSTPRKGVFNVYYDVRDKLLELGVPKEEIAFIHDYPKDDQKMTLFQKVREGEVRVLMGSSKKMGEGMNVQNKVVAVHHLDAPWTPASVEQRDGRALRPGNDNEEVGVYRYVTQSTFDAYRWQLLENKARFIGQAMKGGLDTIEDIGKTVIDYATAKAIAADNPIVMEKVKVESDLTKYHVMHQGWRDQRYRTQKEIDQAENYRAMYQKQLDALEVDLKVRESKPEDKDFSIKFHAIPDLGIKDGIFTDKKEAGKELVKAFGTEFEAQIKGTIGPMPLFSYRGLKFNIRQSKDFDGEVEAAVEGGKSLMRFWAKNPTAYTSEESAVSAYMTKINNVIDQLDQDLTQRQYKLEKQTKKRADLTKWLKDNPEFEHMGKLKELRKRADEIDDQLRETNKAVEEVPELEAIPGQYYKKMPDEEGYVPVKGKKIEVAPWLDTFIHKLDDETWAISEATTGLQITGHHPTQEKAKDSAWDILNRQGQEKVKTLIEENIKKHGPSPWVPEDEIKLAMAGEKAIGAPTGALAKAREMLAKGKDEEAVWQETGWMKGAEGKWRFEIDDSRAKITAEIKELSIDSFDFEEGIKLIDFLVHPALFKAYPQLKKIPIKMELGELNLLTKGLKPGASYSPEKGTIEIRAKNLNQAKDQVIHEIQHAIQVIEGFARGGMPGQFVSKYRQRMWDLMDTVNQYNMALKENIDNPAVYNRLMDKKLAVVKEYQELEEIGPLEAVQKYKRLAGEIEAREVAMRKDLTPELREILPPYYGEAIPREEWIIREGTGTSFSVEPSLAARPEGYKFTKQQQRDVNLIEMVYFPRWLEKSTFKDLASELRLKVKPYISLAEFDPKQVEGALTRWEKEGVTAGKILGTHRVEGMETSIVLALPGRNLKQLEHTTLHELYERFRNEMISAKDRTRLDKDPYFKTIESEADAFAEYMVNTKSIKDAPNFIKRIFLKLKRLLTIIRNGLNARGFYRPEDIWGKMRAGAGVPRKKGRAAAGIAFELTPELKLAMEKGIFQAVAVRLKDGTVYKGRPGEIHLDVIDQIPTVKLGRMHQHLMHDDMGFINQKGQFYTRSEAIKAVNESEARALAAKGLMPEIKLAMEKVPTALPTLEDIQRIFRGQEVTRTPEGNFTVTTQHHGSVEIRTVDRIDENTMAFNLGYGRPRKPGEAIAGKYEDGRIELRRDLADRWILSHESYHFMEDAGIISKADIRILQNKIRALTKQGKFTPTDPAHIGSGEDRALWIESQLGTIFDVKSTTGKILLKIRNFIDRLLEAFGVRTAEAIVQRIETGRIFESPVSIEIPADTKVADQPFYAVVKEETGQDTAQAMHENRSFVNKLFEMGDLARHRITNEVGKLQLKVQELAGKPSRKRIHLGIGYQPKLKRSIASDNLDRAMMVHRDLQNNPDKGDKFRKWADERLKDPKTPASQKLIIKKQIKTLEGALNLTDQQKEFTSYMGELFEDAYKKAKTHKVVQSHRDHYVRRLWNLPKEKQDQVQGLGTGYGFKTFTTAAMPRTFETILDGWMNGYDLKVQGLTSSYDSYMADLVTIIANKAFIQKGIDTKDSNGNSLFSTTKMPGYQALKATGFSVWRWAGKAEIEAEFGDDEALIVDTYGRKFFATPPERIPGAWSVFKDDKAKKPVKTFDSIVEANTFARDKGYKRIERNIPKDISEIFQKQALFAPGPLAEMINKMTATDTWVFKIPVVRHLLRLNSGLKSWILLSSFFHHMAGTRSWIFGVHHGWRKANPVKAYKDGLAKIQDNHPHIELGIKNGLTLGELQDWAENELRQQKGLTESLVQYLGIEPLDKAIQYGKFKRQKFTDSLFKKFFAGLKAEAFVIEYAHELQKEQERYTQGVSPMPPSPDKIAENVARLINADFGGLHLPRMGRNPTLQNMFRLLLLAPDWTESNFRTVSGMIPGLNKTIGKFMGDVAPPAGLDKIYRKFWGRVIFRIAAITILAQMFLNGKDETDEFLEEQMFSNRWNKFRWTELEVSKLYRMLGIDTEGQRMTFSLGGHFFDPLKLINPPRLIKHKGSPMMRIIGALGSRSDWAERPFTAVGELFKTGKTIKKSAYEQKEGFFVALPSITVNQVVNMQPIQLGHLIRYLQGEEDGLTAMMHSMGAAVHKAWRPRIETPIVRAKGPEKDVVFEAIEDMVKRDVLHMAPPSRHLMISGISYEMTREQYEKYLDDSSAMVRRKLSATVISGRWAKLPESRRLRLLTAIIKNARKKVRSRIKKMMLRARRRQLIRGEPTA